MSLNKKASKLFLICLALYLGLSIVVSVVLELAAPGNNDLIFLMSSVAVSIPAFLIPALIFRRRNALPRFKAPRFGHIVIAVIIGAGAIYLNEALSFLNEAVFFGVDIQSNATTAETIMDLSIPTMLIALAVIPPISEEFIMRGALLEVWRRYSPIGAAILTSLLFALLHAAPSALIVYIGVGLLLAAVYLITRNVWLTVTVHFINNLFTALAAISIKSFGGLEEAAETASESAELAEISGLDIESLMGSQSGLMRLFVYYLIIAAVIIVPMLLLLRASCKKRSIGMYASEDKLPAPEGEEYAGSAFSEGPAFEGAEAAAEPGEKGSMWKDGLLWVTIILLVILNVVTGLFEFGVIKQ